MTISIPRWLAGQFEADLRSFIPYVGHISGNVVALTCGSAMAQVMVEGRAGSELNAPSMRNGDQDRINTMLRTMPDVDTTICIDLVRHQSVPPAPQPKARSSFVQTLMDDYNRVALAGMYTNTWIISVIVHTETTPGSGVWNYLRRKPEPPMVTERMLRRLEDVVYLITTTLSDYNPRRLGTREIEVEPGVMMPVTEIGEALHLIRTGIRQVIPHTYGLLSSAIYTEPVVFGPLSFNLNKPGCPRHGAMIGFNNYPARPRVGMFNRLLSAPYCLVMHHSFRFKSAGGAASALRLISQQMRNAGDAADDLVERLQEAGNQTASLKTATGRHHFSLAVYARRPEDLDSIVADACKILSHFGGAAPIREMNLWYNGAMESIYYAQFPGSPIFKARPGDISTRDLATMASLDNFPTGAKSGYWGLSFIRFKTWRVRSRMPANVRSPVWATPSPRRHAQRSHSPSRKPTRKLRTPQAHCGRTRQTSQTTGLSATGMVSSRCRPRRRSSGPILRRPARATRCPRCAAVSPPLHVPAVSPGSRWTPSIQRSERRSAGSAASMGHQPGGQPH